MVSGRGGWTVAGQEAVLQGRGVSARGVVAEVGGFSRDTAGERVSFWFTPG